MSKMKGNCMMGCKHCAYKDIYEKRELKDESGAVYGIVNEFVGREHYCSKDNDAYKAWEERNETNTYEEYKKDVMDCFEPNEFTDSLNSMIDTANEILSLMKK